MLQKIVRMLRTPTSSMPPRHQALSNHTLFDHTLMNQSNAWARLHAYVFSCLFNFMLVHDEAVKQRKRAEFTLTFL